MKLFVLVIATVTALDCWTCQSSDYATCETNGSSMTCLTNEEVCAVTMRKRNGVVEKVRNRVIILRYLSNRIFVIGCHGMQIGRSM